MALIKLEEFSIVYFLKLYFSNYHKQLSSSHKSIFFILKFFISVYVFFLFQFSSLFAGSYHLTPSNYNSSSSWCDTCVELDSNVSVDPTAFSLNSGASEASITLKTVKIRQGQDWKDLSLKWSAVDGDSLAIKIKNSVGTVLLNKTYSAPGDTGSKSFSLSSLKTKSGGLNLTVVITLYSSSSSATLEYLTVSYNSDSLILYPSPYNPGQGNAVIKIDMEKSAVVTISIYDSRYYLVKTIASKKSVSGYDTPFAGYTKSWNGKNTDGNDLPSGIYTLIAKIQKSGGEEKTLVFRFLMIR